MRKGGEGGEIEEGGRRVVNMCGCLYRRLYGRLNWRAS